MKQHKWHKEIKAWADGAEIQYRIKDGNWHDVGDDPPEWNEYSEYRIKPQPKEEEFKWWYERVYLQSPSMCQLKYDDEKMLEAWKEGYKLGVKNDLEL